MTKTEVETGLPEGLKLSLTVVDGPDAGKSMVLDRPEIVVGRGQKAEFRLTDDTVSSRHFTLEIKGGEARLSDLGTTNGTLVNGEKCDHAVLITGDEIRIGESRLVFRVGTTVVTSVASAASAPGADAAKQAAAKARMEALKAQLEGAPPEETVLDGSADIQPKVGVVRPDTAVFLEVIGGHGAGNVFDLSQPRIYLIGRGKGDVPLTDPKCSTKHAQIQIQAEEQYFLSDLASTNGTFLNEIRTGRRKLKHMDIIRIGETRLRFSCMLGTVPLSK